MATTLQNKIKKLSVARRKKINKRAKELIAKEMTLRALNTLRQADMSSRLHMKKDIDNKER